MKKAIIAILVCVNAALLVALILGKGAPQAHAYPGSVMPNNTIMITGQIRDDEDAVYIIDMATERLAAFEFQGKGAAKRLRALGSRDLKIDLK
ncbi:MAG: hypothetical protein QGH94_13805 [Phycisphaerae bacterium]|jgi:hypothetical protein|nr:hypothetical protein [Phycisphaerae bacterium]MDP7289056.1 hypothetical protein [Phycisphaerae bacterium]